jgi:hypothetical protein
MLGIVCFLLLLCWPTIKLALSLTTVVAVVAVAVAVAVYHGLSQ